MGKYITGFESLQLLINEEGLAITEPEVVEVLDPIEHGQEAAEADVLGGTSDVSEPEPEPEPPRPPKDEVTGFTLVDFGERMPLFTVYVEVIDTHLKREIDGETLKIRVSIANEDYHATNGHCIFRVNAIPIRGKTSGYIPDAWKGFKTQAEAEAYFIELLDRVKTAVNEDKILDEIRFVGNMSVTTNREARDQGDPTLAD